jgi:hypothetical protein
MVNHGQGVQRKNRGRKALVKFIFETIQRHDDAK